MSLIFSNITMLLLFNRSFRLTYSITKPISEILHNIKKVGKGEYKNIAYEAGPL